MAHILDEIVASKREEVAARKSEWPLERLRDQAAEQPPALDFPAALRGPRPRGQDGGGTGRGEANIIAELKRKSPSKGEFPWHGDVKRQISAYEAGGAKAVSVLTDAPYFGGSPELLREIKGYCHLPLLQKEFLIEPYQVVFARSIGADACLLIAACLPGGLLAEMVGLAREVGVHVLVEVISEQEFERASAAGALVIGVNNRDLRTFTIDPARTERLLPLYGEQHVCVAESGIHTPQDIERLRSAGSDAFLIGEALMVAEDPAELLRHLRGGADTSHGKRAVS